jgi:hypothetical protein
MSPKVCVPAKGWAIDMHQPIGVLVNLPLCKSHFDEFRKDWNWDEAGDLKGMIERMAQGKQPPDFDRAFVTSVHVDSEEFRQFLIHQQLSAGKL